LLAVSVVFVAAVAVAVAVVVLFERLHFNERAIMETVFS
jgi:hypothetical protein